MNYKRRYFDIIVLLSSLCLISAMACFIPGKKDNASQRSLSLSIDIEQGEIDSSPASILDDLKNIDDIKRYLQPYIFSKSIKAVTKVMQGLSAQDAATIVRQLLSESKGFNESEKMSLLLGIANNYQSFDEQVLLFNVLTDDVVFALEQKAVALLIIAAQRGYTRALPSILRWAEKVGEGTKEMLINQAIAYCIEHNLAKEMKKLFEQGVTIGRDQATNLLWMVLRANKSELFIPIFVVSGADMSAIRDGQTMLIQAVENRNLAQLKALLEAQADPNQAGDDRIGTPVQNAVTLKFPEADIMLRNYGAKR